MDLKNSTPCNAAHYMVYSFQSPFSEGVFVTFGNPAFCLDLYLTGLDFPGELSTLVASVKKRSSVDHQNSRNTWCQIVRGAVCSRENRTHKLG